MKTDTPLPADATGKTSRLETTHVRAMRMCKAESSTSKNVLSHLRVYH